MNTTTLGSFPTRDLNLRSDMSLAVDRLNSGSTISNVYQLFEYDLQQVLLVDLVIATREKRMSILTWMASFMKPSAKAEFMNWWEACRGVNVPDMLSRM